MDRPSKLARLQSLRSRLPFISQSGLSALLAAAKHEPLPELSSSRSIRRARDAGVAEVTPYGKLHQQFSIAAQEGPELPIEVQYPFAMLYHCTEHSHRLSQIIETAAAVTPNYAINPWSLVLYADEIMPGNQLSYKGARKVWGVYWTILEFGSDALSDEA